MKTRKIKFIVLLIFSGALFATGCATLPEDVPRTHSSAYKTPELTSAGQIFADEIAAHPDKSGVALVTDGPKALLIRNAMAGMAEKTLDVQYFIWDSDTAGLLLFQRLVEAADRGVRVRVLLDDLAAKEKDISLASFSAHPNLEIRVFNPMAGRRKGAFAFLADFSRVNHRMHNKLFVMDNTLCVIGSRNIADIYFGIGHDHNNRDLDLLTVGPAVQQLSSIFDLYWNSPWAFPADTLTKRQPTPEEMSELKELLARRVSEDANALPFSIEVDTPAMYDRLEKLQPSFIWTPVKVLYDTPDKVESSKSGITPRSRELLEQMEDELFIEMAYFVPGKEGVANAKALIERGVKVKVLTNSLASNNLVSAQSGYATYRKRLLKAGVELYELRPDAAIRENWVMAGKDSTVTLHTKAFVFDREKTFIGTFNLDPRSKLINTEVGLMISNPELALQVIEFMKEGTQPDNSYRVQLDNHTRKLSWITREGDDQKIYHRDPATSWWRRFKAGFARILSIEGQL